MYLLGVLVLIVLVYFIFIKKGKSAAATKPVPKAQSSNDSLGSSNSQSGGKSFLPPIPSGYQIYAPNVPVAGIQYRKDEAMRFAKSSNQELDLQREPTNEQDSNAIKLIGVSGSSNYFIGYLPKELSAQIGGTGLFDVVKPRLARVYVGENGFLDIQYQIIGPKAEKKKFDAFLSNQPASSSQKEYFKFFGLSIPKGLTAGQAEQAISEHRKASKPEEQDEWDGYTSILEEFDDGDFGETYGHKKIGKTVLIDAINQLKHEGKTYKFLSNNIDDVVERVIKLKPELEKQI